MLYQLKFLKWFFIIFNLVQDGILLLVNYLLLLDDFQDFVNKIP